MKQQELTPEKSLELITQVIQEAKTRLEEDGVIYMMWGLLLALASTAQYFLLIEGMFEINYYPYFILPVGMIVSRFYYAKKQKSKSSQILSTISLTWGIIGLNLMILGFFCWPFLTGNLTPIILILMGVGTIVSGQITKSRLILIAGLLINLAGFVGFQLELIYHPLLLGISSFLFIFVPGLLLKIKNR